MIRAKIVRIPRIVIISVNNIDRLPVQTSDTRKVKVKSTQEFGAFCMLPVVQCSGWKMVLDELFQAMSRGQVLHQSLKLFFLDLGFRLRLLITG